MASSLNVEGKEYTAAALAGKRFGYTKDYLLLLIKDGKIDGRKIGNKWYVHVPSAELFFKEAAERKKERQKQVSVERKTELRQHTLSRGGVHRKAAVLETLAILVIGLSLGATGYLGTSSQQALLAESGFNFFEKLAVSFYSVISPETAKSSPNGVDDAGDGAHDGGEPDVSFVVAPEAMLSTESVDALRRSFSDPVNVTIDPVHPDTGIVVPEFKHRESEAYRFLMVPVHIE